MNIHNWIIRVYDNNREVDDWVLFQMDDNEAYQVAQKQVDQFYPGYEWTISDEC